MIRLFPRTVLVVLLACCTSGCGLLEKIRPPELPENSAYDRVVWLDQGWSDEERFWFHHTSQGTATLPMPYRWFVALERPSLSLFGDPGLLSDEEYLRRIGFVPSRRGEGSRAWPASNPDGLPVGFARMSGVTDPVTGEPLDRIGFTCAACHTGHLEYDGASIRIDGGPAMTDLGAFRKAMRLALFYTKYVPFRFARFADRVLGEARTREQTAELESRLDELIARGRAWAELSNPHVEEHDDTVEEGFTRLDALNRIGNQLFGQDLYVPGTENALVAANLAPLTAPVNYPHIWATSWFDWVQYDGSIMQPMIRNAGEALGVSARVNLVRPDDDLFASTVAVEQIFALEQLLAGDPPRRSNGSGGGPSSGARHGFSGLRHPPGRRRFWDASTASRPRWAGRSTPTCVRSATARPRTPRSSGATGTGPTPPTTRRDAAT